jgi:hypothetical protein
MLRPTVQSASPSWNKAPIWGLGPDIYYCQTVAGLLMWALSLTRGRVSFVRVTVSSSKSFMLTLCTCVSVRLLQQDTIQRVVNYCVNV